MNSKLSYNITLSELRNKGIISFFCAVLSMIIIPVYIWFLPPVIILWTLSWIWESRGKMKQVFKKSDKNRTLFYLFLLFIVWQVTGLLYSENVNAGLENISARLSLILFPLLLLSPGELIKREALLLSRVFSVSTTLFIVFCFGFAFYKSISIQDGIFLFNPIPEVHFWENYFFSKYFSIFQHPSYLAMYVILSVFISLKFFFDENAAKRKKILWLTISIFLLFSLYFLSSRASLLAALLLVPLFFLYKFYKRGKLKFAIVGILLILFLLVPVILMNKKVNIYVKDVAESSLSEVVNKDIRVIIWKASFNIIEKNFLLGVGTGDVKAELNNEYRKIGNQAIIEQEYNVHNQFIEVLLENGLIGLLILVSIFCYMLYIAFTGKNMLYLFFLLMVLIFFFFETMLNRLAGVSFFALFSFLLLYIKSD